MPKDFSTKWIVGHLRGAELAKVRAALERMGIQDDQATWDPLRWELLAWAVAFAQRDMSTMTEEECNSLDEEIQVVQLFSLFNMNPWVPTREELRLLAQRVLTILSALVDTGVVRIGPLPVEFVVLRGADRQETIPEAQRATGFVVYEGWGPALLGHPPAEGIAFQAPPTGMDGVIHCVAQLVSKYPGAVRRCPLCKRLFAQFRSSAQYCSRICQSQAWAHVQWERKKQDRSARLAKEVAKKLRTSRKKKTVAPHKGGK